MFLHPLGLFALFAVPVVVGLHLYRRRFRRQVVSAVFLWASQDRAPVAGRKREPLHTSPSFWSELFAALLLALAFAGPRACGAGEAEHLVVVLDASASMGARAEGELLRERAVELVRERIGGLPRGSRVTLVESGPRPTLLAGPAAFVGEATARLEGYAPGAARHDLAPAVALGLQFAGDGRLVLVTDGFDPDVWPAEVEVVSIGRPVGNLAITHATRGRGSAGREKVHLTLSSFAFESRTVPVRIGIGGEPLEERAVTLEPGERTHLAFELPAGAPLVEARIPADALEIDDVAWLAPLPPRTVALASTLPPDLSRQLGLMTPGSTSNVDRWRALVPDSIDAEDPAAAHIVLGEAVAAGGGWCLALESSGTERRHLIGPFLIDRRHPLLAGVTLEGIIWSASEPRASAGLGGAPIVSAGNEPLATEERIEGRRVFRLNLDPRTSSLHRSPDWPILLANLAEMRRGELPGPLRTTLAIGEPFEWRGRGEVEYLFEGEGVERRIPARETLAVEDVTVPGVYRLSSIDKSGGAHPLCEIGYSFCDPRESDLTALLPGTRAGATRPATIRAGFTWMEILFLTLALGVLALDWLVLARNASGAGATQPEGNS